MHSGRGSRAPGAGQASSASVPAAPSPTLSGSRTALRMKDTAIQGNSKIAPRLSPRLGSCTAQVPVAWGLGGGAPFFLTPAVPRGGRRASEAGTPGACPPSPRASCSAPAASLSPNPAHVFRAVERRSRSSVIVAVITQMICSTVTSSQRCHLKLKIHVKSRDATFKQTVET